MIFKEKITSVVKYPSIFSHQMEAVVFIILQIFFSAWGFENWEISLGYSLVLLGKY